MNTEMGEYIVGAYLKLIKKCDFIEYSVRRPGGHLAGLNELDVMGLDFKNKTAYLCEVTTHQGGALYGSSKSGTIETIKKKYTQIREYAESHLPATFPKHHFMFWSPVVSAGVAKELKRIKGLELVINENYAACVDELLEQARSITYDTGNPAFWIFQILGHLRRRK
jgi:hypothetical protein